MNAVGRKHYYSLSPKENTKLLQSMTEGNVAKAAVLQTGGFKLLLKPLKRTD